MSLLSVRTRSLVVHLAVLLLLVPALLPQGMMVARDGALGQIEITLCSAVGGRNVWLDLDTGRLSDVAQLSDEHQQDSTEHAASDQLCPFAVASAVALAQSTVLGPVFTPPARPRHFAITLTARSFRGGRMPPRGPPLMS